MSVFQISNWGHCSTWSSSLFRVILILLGLVSFFCMWTINFLSTFVKDAIFSPVYYFCLIKYQMTTAISTCLHLLFCDLVYIFVFVLEPYNYYLSFIVYLDIWTRSTSFIILFLQECFGYLGSLVIYFCKEYCGYFDWYWFKM